ncbi:hypothetical protein LCGC14_0600580 [marine sediment metagenome]|uniref:Uncharacterized protein n=1 Tax=marine sediment metagenome TaxID=412755 RepID=A0A0F9RUP0_9ZZZZ
MAKKRIFISWCIVLFLASFCCGEAGDLELSAGLNVVTDVNVGDNVKIGLLNTSSFPDVHLYISKGDSPSGSVKELFRLERFGDDDVGQDGIGVSQTFYLENDASSIIKVGTIEWSLPSAFAGLEALFSLKHLTSGGERTILKTDNWKLGFLAFDDDAHVFFNFINTGVSTDRTLTVDMGGSDREIDWSAAAGGEFLFIEAGARLDQDYTTDATPTFASLIIANAGNLGSVSDPDAIQIEADGDVVLSQDLSLEFGDFVSEQNPDGADAIRIKGTDYIDIVIGGMTGLFAVWNVADTTPVFYVDERGDTDIAGDLTVGTLLLTGGSITDSGGAISFGDENLTTTGNMTVNDLIIGNARFLGSVSDNDAIQIKASGDIVISQDLAVSGTLDVTGATTVGTLTAVSATFDILTLDLTQDYVFSDRSTAMTIQSQTAATPFNIELSSLDSDGTDNVLFNLYALGPPSGSDPAEFLSMGYLASGTIFEIKADKLFGGTVRALRFVTGTNTTQLVLNIDGTIDAGGLLTVSPSIDTPFINLTDNTQLITVDGTTFLANDGTDNLFLGADVFAADSGSQNVGIGFEAGGNVVTTGGGNNGMFNTFVGFRAGKGAVGSTSNFNIGLGGETLRLVSSGRSNMAIGYKSMFNLTTGIDNVGVGVFTLLDITGGDRNMAIGKSALANVPGSSDDNIAIGNLAGFGGGAATILQNVLIGSTAGTVLTDARQNVMIGHESGKSATTGDRNVFLGHESGFNQTTNSDLLIIDNINRSSIAAELTDCLIYGVFNSTVASQSLRVNAGTLNFNGGVDTDLVSNWIGTTNSGAITWMEDEDRFEFADDIKMNGETITDLGGLHFNSATELTIVSGEVTVTKGHHSIDTEGNAANDDLDTINGGNAGEILLILPANDDRTVRIRHGVGNIFLKHQVESKSYSFSSPSGSSGTFYSGGYYNWSATEAALTQISPSVTHSAANSASACHIGIVAGGPGTVNTGVIKITVAGTTIDDDGVRAASQTVTLVADITTLSTDDYVETTEKWIGQVTIALATASGTPVTFNLDINYGCTKYEDFGNQAFTINVLEVVGLAGASDSGFNLRLFHHSSADWTFAASGFVPGGTVLANMNTDYSTEDELVNGESFAYKRVNLNTDISGDDAQGLVLEITTSANKAVEIMDMHFTVHTAPNFSYMATTKQHLVFMKHGSNWLEL